MFNSAVTHPGSVHSGSSQSDAFLISIAKLLDTSIIVVMLVGPSILRADAWPLRYTIALLLAVIAFHVIAGLLTLYRPWRGESITRQFFRIVLVWVSTMFVLLFVGYMFKATAGFSRLALTAWFFATPLLMSGWRTLARTLMSRWLERDTMRRNALIWGSGDAAKQLAHTVQNAPGLGLRLVESIAPEAVVEDNAILGAIPNSSPASRIVANSVQPDDATAGTGPEIPLPATNRAPLSQSELIEMRARRGDFSILYIVLGGVSKHDAIDVVERLADTTVSVYMVPDYFATHLFHGHWSNLGGVPLVSVFDTPFWGAGGWLKKVQDVTLGSIILAIALLPMTLIALAIKLTSRGPIFFRQRRYGIDGKEITVMKFRTMTVAEDGANVIQARKDDPRLTPIGGFLRKHSLDELPQFVNVLRGEMSIVGPRPHAVAHNEVYRSKVKGYMLRHKVKPGITGWAQINGWRGETDDLHKMEKRVEYDLWYIRNWSFWLDMKIILLTILRGFASRNAY